jgi:sugar lactone lactonase YvrE
MEGVNVMRKYGVVIIQNFCCCILLLTGLLLAANPVRAEVKAGDILVIDYFGGTDGRGALVAVDPATGQRRTLSDFGDAAQGSSRSSPLNVAVFRCSLDERAGSAGGKSGDRNPHDCGDGETVQIFVSDYTALFKVDPNTGYRTIVSDLGQGDLIEGVFNYGLAVNAKGKVIANFQELSDPGYHGVIVRIDPETDTRVLVSDLRNPDQGAIDTGTFITDLGIEHSGKILIGTATDPDFASGAIFRVNPRTGKRKLLSDLTNAAQGPIASLWFSTGLATEASKQILAITNAVADENNNPFGGDFLLRIDPKTGQRTILSDFGNPAQGIIGFAPRGTVVEKSGKIVVSAVVTEFSSSLFRVDPKTGQRTLLSDSANPEQGPPLSAGITYMAIVPKDGNVED